jgi:hypothetical protein
MGHTAMYIMLLEETSVIIAHFTSVLIVIPYGSNDDLFVH